MFELVVSTLQLCLVVIVVFQVILYQKIRKVMATVTAGGGNRANDVNDDDVVFKDLMQKRSTPYYRERNSTLLKNVLYQCEDLLETKKNNTSNPLLSTYDNQYRTINNNEFRSIQMMLDKIRPIVKPIMKLSCRNCTPTSKKDFATRNSIVVVNNVLKPNRMFTSSHSDDDQQKRTFFGRFSFLRQISQVVKYQYTHVGEEILQNSRIREAIDETALQYFYDGTNTQHFTNENHQRLVLETEKRAKSILTAMKSRISDFLLRFISWILYKLLPCFLSDVRVRPEQIEMLRKASETKNPLIFLPVHKSHLDYILVSFILFNNNIRAPLVAAGDNLRIPFFGSLLRGLGAFFIKRRINPIMGNKDHVYKAVLQEYMNECLKSGHNIEFFLEGGRTRSGKTCMPKYGLLSVIVDALTNGVIDDAFLVPIGINYERLVDGNFVRELLGEPKQMETFTAALKGIWSVLNSNYGSVCVDFCQPFSLRELIRTFERGLSENPNRVSAGTARKLFRNNLSISSIYGTDLVHEECKQIVENISRHILWDCTNTTAIMGTNAIAFVLLVKHRDAHKNHGIEMSELLGDLQRIAFDLKWDERYFAFEYAEDYARMVTKTHRILGSKLIEMVSVPMENDVDGGGGGGGVRQQKVFARPELESIIELSYYANILNHFYALQSVIANVIINSPKDDLNENEILDNCAELCDILQFEFIFCKPCQDLSTILSLTLENMIVTDEILYVQPPKNQFKTINGNGIPVTSTTTTTTSTVSKENGKNKDDDVDDDDDDDVIGRSNDEIADDDGIEMLTKRYYRKDVAFDRNKRLRFLKSVLEPLICTYTEVTAKLIDLAAKPCTEQEFIRGLLADLKLKWHDGSLKYAESISVDTIKNALKLLQKWSIIDLQSRDDVMQIIAIENAAKIDQLLMKFAKFR